MINVIISDIGLNETIQYTSATNTKYINNIDQELIPLIIDETGHQIRFKNETVTLKTDRVNRDPIIKLVYDLEVKKGEDYLDIRLRSGNHFANVFSISGINMKKYKIVSFEDMIRIVNFDGDIPNDLIIECITASPTDVDLGDRFLTLCVEELLYKEASKEIYVRTKGENNFPTIPSFLLDRCIRKGINASFLKKKMMQEY